MYWWNASKLAEDLREGRVDEKERFKYFLATFIVWVPAVQLLPFPGGASGVEAWISAAVSLAAVLVGITACYAINKSGDNIDFVGRMICLGWPVSIGLTVLYSPVFSIFVYEGGWNPYLEGAFFGILFIFPYYLIICRYIAAAAEAEEAKRVLWMGEAGWSLGKVLIGILACIGFLIF